MIYTHTFVLNLTEKQEFVSEYNNFDSNLIVLLQKS